MVLRLTVVVFTIDEKTKAQVKNRAKERGFLSMAEYLRQLIRDDPGVQAK